MKFEQSHVLKELPKQFFASLVQKVNRKLAEGHDVINLGQGNPDQPMTESCPTPISSKYAGPPADLSQSASTSPLGSV